MIVIKLFLNPFAPLFLPLPQKHEEKGTKESSNQHKPSLALVTEQLGRLLLSVSTSGTSASVS